MFIGMHGEVHKEVLSFLGTVSLAIALPLLLMAGLLIAAGVVGERIWLHIASRPSRLLGLMRSLVVGILITGLALLVPFFGWLFFLGVTMAGLGAAIIALFQRKKKPELSPPEIEAGEQESSDPPEEIGD